MTYAARTSFVHSSSRCCYLLDPRSRGSQPIKRRSTRIRSPIPHDAHVETQTTRSVFDYHDDVVLGRWNKDNQPHRDLIPGSWH